MAGNTFLGALSKEVLAKLEVLGQPKSLRGLYLYGKVYAAIIAIFVLDSYLDNLAFTLLCVVLIAGRQHSLYILNHDASHYGLFRKKWANKWVASVLSNFVMFHHPSAWSFEQWQRVHYFHHRELFTKKDPNYMDRVASGDVSRSQTIPRLILACIKAGLLSPVKFFTAKQDYVPPAQNITHKEKDNHLRTLFLPFKDDQAMEVERYAKLAFMAAMLFLVARFNLWQQFILLWILPMYTVFPMILTFMDLTEHRWAEPATGAIENSRSINYGPVAKTIISFLPRGLHREHHLYPRAIAADLPKLSKLLCENGYLAPPIQGLPALFSEINGRASVDRGMSGAR